MLKCIESLIRIHGLFSEFVYLPRIRTGSLKNLKNIPKTRSSLTRRIEYVYSTGSEMHSGHLQIGRCKRQ